MKRAAEPHSLSHRNGYIHSQAEEVLRILPKARAEAGKRIPMLLTDDNKVQAGLKVAWQAALDASRKGRRRYGMELRTILYALLQNREVMNSRQIRFLGGATTKGSAVSPGLTSTYDWVMKRKLRQNEKLRITTLPSDGLSSSKRDYKKTTYCNIGRQ